MSVFVLSRVYCKEWDLSVFLFSIVSISIFSSNQRLYFYSIEGETIKIMNQDLVRLDRFDGSNFTRWQDKVRFLLMALNIFYILDPILAPLLEPKKKEISPYELWKGRKPNIGYFKVWGCLAYCKKTDSNKKNWVKGPLSVHL